MSTGMRRREDGNRGDYQRFRIVIGSMAQRGRGDGENSTIKRSGRSSSRFRPDKLCPFWEIVQDVNGEVPRGTRWTTAGSAGSVNAARLGRICPDNGFGPTSLFSALQSSWVLRAELHGSTKVLVHHFPASGVPRVVSSQFVREFPITPLRSSRKIYPSLISFKAAAVASPRYVARFA